MKHWNKNIEYLQRMERLLNGQKLYRNIDEKIWDVNLGDVTTLGNLDLLENIDKFGTLTTNKKETKWNKTQLKILKT